MYCGVICFISPFLYCGPFQYVFHIVLSLHVIESFSCRRRSPFILWSPIMCKSFHNYGELLHFSCMIISIPWLDGVLDIFSPMSPTHCRILFHENNNVNRCMVYLSLICTYNPGTTRSLHIYRPYSRPPPPQLCSLTGKRREFIISFQTRAVINVNVLIFRPNLLSRESHNSRAQPVFGQNLWINKIKH